MDTETRINALEQEVRELRDLVSEGNYGSMQVFRKVVSMLRLKLEEYPTNPTSAKEGELAYVNGRLMLCTAGSPTSPTWVAVGTQT